MPTYTGAAIARSVLRRIGLIDPTEAGEAEQIDYVLELATDMLDEWATDKLTISGITRKVYDLAASTQSYTIGDAGAFNQEYPSSIEKWSVIPDDDAADPVEQPRGRPVTHIEWQRIRVKTLEAAYPHTLYFDRTFAAGLGQCHFYPVPNNANVDVVLYTHIPSLVALARNTEYNLARAAARAVKLNLAIEAAEAFGVDVPPALEMRALKAKGSLKRSNIVRRQSPIRSEFAIGSRRRTMNIYTDA